ncbi:MAG: hypothetical protein CML50_15465 [Rhodobacteraceae bacterium]|jgi:hypothetical protein|uniref:Uncharacterized protein n=1 Tax=Salipiger profundus TaxID=1229727 RepID=A0A1U7D7V2_9RHOB|nr:MULTISPECIES: hypothetical protein [Salipiger]APX24209.1 hypothetical protein Ga0080559_TMP3413 [Salipiger profundus]MAB07397.1 hypothetical protein [Paracoccaceae bacterium]GFZ95376.1 hypothetical protein GCM10011326_02790 [Salipiger profundus]SFB87766.1 hypothetical protein SAMN05444415_101263 [Salipiger profundus]
MRKYAFRKMTHDDFTARLHRLSAQNGATPANNHGTAQVQHPYLMMMAGFIWAYFMFSVARKRDHIEISLRQGDLPERYHDYVIYGLAALLAVSAVMLALHLVRFLIARRRARRGTPSGRLLVGAIAAAALFYTPASVYETAFGLLDGNAQAMILSASESVSTVLPAELTTASLATTPGSY